MPTPYSEYVMSKIDRNPSLSYAGQKTSLRCCISQQTAKAETESVHDWAANRAHHSVCVSKLIEPSHLVPVGNSRVVWNWCSIGICDTRTLPIVSVVADVDARAPIAAVHADAGHCARHVRLRGPVPSSTCATATRNIDRFCCFACPGLCDAIVSVWIGVGQRIVLNVAIEIPALRIARVLIAAVVRRHKAAHRRNSAP